MTYGVGQTGQVLEFVDEVLRHFARYRQVRWRREAGGQLFARFDGSRIEVLKATGPRRSDRRGRNFYVPDRNAEQREIDALHAEALHYIGDWHTHAQDVPEPSPTDLKSISESVRKSTHDLAGFVLVVVGRLEPPRGLSVTIHDGVGNCALVPGLLEE